MEEHRKSQSTRRDSSDRRSDHRRLEHRRKQNLSVDNERREKLINVLVIKEKGIGGVV